MGSLTTCGLLWETNTIGRNNDEAQATHTHTHQSHTLYSRPPPPVRSLIDGSGENVDTKRFNDGDAVWM